MTRYFRLYGYFLRFSFSRSMEFRLDFTFRIAMDVFYYMVQILFYKVLFLNTGTIAGWNESQAMIFVSGYLIVDAINMTLFSNNMWVLPSYVNRGDLDYYLIRPVSSLFFLSLRDFAANSFVNLVMAAGISVWAFMAYPEPIEWYRIVLFYLFICVGTLIHYTVRLIMILSVFWTHSGRGLDQLFWPMTKIIERPDGIFKGWTRRILVSLLPLALVASFPARLVFEALTWEIFAHILIVASAFFCLLLFVWNKALANYSSASS
ncbi:MAG: ABC-2 family transporter protein [Bdellovibrionia bacterium]